MSDDNVDAENTAENTAEESAAGAERETPKGKNDLVDAAIGLAVLGLGAALLNGGRGGLGGIVRTITHGPTSRTPPIAPHLRRVDPSMWRNPPTI